MGAAIASVVAASIAAVVAIITNLMTRAHNRSTLKATQEHNKRTIDELRLAERRKQLSTALQELLVPLYMQLNSMKALFKVFTSDKPKGFRTLPYLLDPGSYEIEGQKVDVTLSDSDRKILEEILQVEKRIEDLLILKGGLIDDPELSKQYVPDPKVTDIEPEAVKDYGLFALSIAHFTALRLAYHGAIKGNPERYAHFVYPRELNEKVYVAIERIQKELKDLSAVGPGLPS